MVSTTARLGDAGVMVTVTTRWFSFLYIASPQQGDLRLSGPSSGQAAGGGARTRDRRVPTDLRADSLATVPSTPPTTRCQQMQG
ncbi:hypothetical protein PoB_004451100 [Plakobranchus ocellatus]|uniref:Uncharacterized protein n=1 Tax=Plakobranchus ocellatus TaxID=259542 RepID=A0AAV4BC45_9GAST|nr:hypothetical protein PoB_004451100 [Plakobranchus ocellatus]